MSGRVWIAAGVALAASVLGVGALRDEPMAPQIHPDRPVPVPLVSAPAPGGAPARETTGPPVADPEALAAWFEARVLAELADAPVDGGPIPLPGTPGGPIHARLAADPRVNWAYVDDVFSGRVSGIPSETKAGISLPELDELGDIPYVEQLRREQRFEELRELGFVNETVPWPACIRTGSCRRDRASSPPPS